MDLGVPGTANKVTRAHNGLQSQARSGLPQAIEVMFRKPVLLSESSQFESATKVTFHTKYGLDLDWTSAVESK